MSDSPISVSLSELLLDRYLSGECTRNESRAIGRILDNHSVERDALEAFVGRLDGIEGEHGERRITPAADALRRLHASSVLAGTTPRSHKVTDASWWRSAITIAAAVVAVISVGMYNLRSTGGATTTYTTANGERATIRLTDGTMVMLNVASRLDIPANFGRNSRTVQLHGEAFFDVAHTTGTPFTVDANGTQTTVLGTQFGVRAYDREGVQVAVQQGRVTLNEVVLVPRDIAYVSTGSKVTVTHNQPLGAALGFHTGRLVLQDVQLRDAIHDLDRWYDADIRLADPTIGDMPIHAELLSGSIGDLMEALRVTLAVRVVRVGHVLTLSLH